jgi:hypothetical protein
MNSDFNVYSFKKDEEQKIIDWITSELNEEELMEAKERVKNSNMLADIPIQNLFPYFTRFFSLCKSTKIDKSTPMTAIKSQIELQMKSHLPKVLSDLIADDDKNL